MSLPLTLRPSWRLLLRRPHLFVAFGAGAGLAPFAPGTVGTLAAVPLYLLLAPRIGPYAFLAVVAALFLLGVAVCGKAARTLGVPDYGGIVWDEIVAFLLVLFFVPATPQWLIAAFVLFRFFDIVKPPPIREVERRLPHGWGIMADDLIAALYALFALAVVSRLAGGPGA